MKKDSIDVEFFSVSSKNWLLLKVLCIFKEEFWGNIFSSLTQPRPHGIYFFDLFYYFKRTNLIMRFVPNAAGQCWCWVYTFS